MDVPSLLALAPLPIGAVVVVIALAAGIFETPRRRGVLPFALSGAALLVIWMVLGYRSGVRADETGTSGSVFSDAGWLVAAVASSICSLALQLRPRR
ncbi:hypothetical protein O2W18_18230 [Modestobacter sp. VKM Ac-2983]|uniref:hypothetical protein n=1 Tax=Modestobacter sp. VKM Ac-2983 TaxID=3004137 RepID=UPI0022AB556D|nr:hypothetical protein [Modestobacter sp. VKM Ac-2983]MCZ2807049.1 hypothetical protein [Modestobacter sp. VKM Ac-2983]